MTLWAEIVCDTCSRAADTTQQLRIVGGRVNLRQLRNYLRNHGWVSTLSGMDYCQCCSGNHKNGPMGFCYKCNRKVEHK